MIEFENVKFGDIEYTLVEIYETLDNDEIYHFLSDDSQLFCRKIDNKYEIITDENQINNIIEEFGLAEREFLYGRPRLTPYFAKLAGLVHNIKHLDEDEIQAIIDEAAEKLTKLNCKIDKKTIESRLANTGFCIGDFTDKMVYVEAFYHLGAKTIFLQELPSESSNLSERRTRLHETIHAIEGENTFVSAFRNHQVALIEGATENIVEKLYGTKSSRLEEYLRFNFSKDATYPKEVAIIRQMELALGREIDEDILMGRRDFFKEFAEKYGKDTFRVIAHRTRRLLPPSKVTSINKYFRETQDILLNKVFEKDFEVLESPDDMRNYFEKLQKFSGLRGVIYDRDSGECKDPTFEEFYNKKLNQAKEILQEKNHDIKFLEEFQYKMPEFYPLESEIDSLNAKKRILSRKFFKEQSIPLTDTDGYEFTAKQKGGKEFIAIKKDGKIIDLSERNLGVKTSTFHQLYSVNCPHKNISPETQKLLDTESTDFQPFITPEETKKFIENSKIAQQKRSMQTIAETQEISRVTRILSWLKEKAFDKSSKTNTKEKGDEHDK